MNIIPNNETITTSNLTTGWTNQSTSNSNNLANRNWELNVDSNTDNSQWSMNSNQNSNQSVVSNINSSSSSTSQQQQQTINQSSDLETNSSLMNEHNNLTTNKNWSQVVDNTTTATTNNSISSSVTNQLDSPIQSNELNNNELIKASIKEAAEKFTNVELYSDTWGNIPINQATPWDCPANQANYQAPPREVHSFNGIIDNNWKYSSSTTGTDIWEANIRNKSTNGADQLSPNDNKNAQNWNSAGGSTTPIVTNHFGGTWGEDDTPVQSSNSSKMWNGPPSNGLNSAASINNNWMNENDKQWSKQWNEDDKVLSMNSNMNKGTNDASFSTWKDSGGNGGWNENESNSGNMANELTDDGTALWNKRQNGGQVNARWKEDNNNDLLMNKSKMNNMTNQCANGINAHMQNGFSSASPGVLRLPSANSINNKLQQQQQSMQQANLNSKSNSNWLDQTGGWNDSNQMNNKNLNNGQANGMFWNSNAANADSNAQLSWNNKPKDNNMIMQSYQFKVLADKGFRKENIETALRNSNMNIKEAIDELRADVLKENCNDLDKRKNSGFNHTSSLPPNSSISNRNTSQFNQMSQQPNQMFRNNPLNNNNLNKASNTANTVLDKRIGNLVQQLQLAVQSGHLNAQILNQPLNMGTIQLINQLLQFAKTLQQLQQQSNSNMNKNMGPSSQSELNVQITVIKQRISNLQNQIRTQQASLMNQQQHQQQQNNQQSVPNNLELNNINNSNNGLNNGLSINPLNNNNLPMGNADFTKSLTSPDSPSLVNDFRELQQSNQQSRLSTWKNSGSNFNENSQGFSRAPGSIKPANNTNWFNEENWVMMDASISNDIITSPSGNLNMQNQAVATTFINDSVPEFEPGKPWKGSQIKSSDDDPHLTPGSVNRSILSLSNFNNWTSKNNNTASTSVAGLPTNTWTFNNNGTANTNSPNWNGFNSNESSSPVENLWQSGSVLKGPPPGLSPNKDSKAKNMTFYLLIKNLTPQIDGSTLRTLCQQHGPLQSFNPLNNGVAIVKYKIKEDAIKAQSALNNCFLSNTTILVDLIPESEVQHYLSGQQMPSSNLMNWNNSNNNATASNGVYRNGQAVTNNHLWRNNAANQVPQVMTTESQWTFNGGVNLWNNSIDATASMSNLLPGDLLNGESA